MKCNRCGYKALSYDESIHTCTPHTVSPTARGHIEYRADGTQHNIKTKENPKTILWQTKKRGPKKI